MTSHIATGTARSTGAGLYQSALTLGPATLIADEPVDLGGFGTGPTPYDLLAAALATCTTMTLRFYAQRQGWDIGQVETVVTHQRVAGQQSAEGQPADRFDRTIHFARGLAADVRDKLLAIADRCPVHKTLTAGAQVVTAAAPGDAA